jgi:hypothetical protein
VVDGFNAWEPTLGVHPGGEVFVTAFEGADLNWQVIRSDDEGDNWASVGPGPGGGPTRTHVTSLDPYIYMDGSADGDSARVYTVDLYVGCSFLSYSDDKGDSWITNPAACGQPANDHQTLFAGPPVSSSTIGYHNVVYYCWNDIARPGAGCSKSLDGGLTFVPVGRPFEAPDCDQATGHGYAGPDGTIYVPRANCQPELAISRDEGATWDVVQIAEIGASGYHEAGVVADKKGNVYFLWMAADRLPHLAISRDGGKTWGKPMQVGAPGVNETNLPTIAIGNNGRIAIAYMGTANSPGKPWDFEGCLPGCDEVPMSYGPVTWNGYIGMTANALAKRPLFYTAAVNDPSNPLVRGTCGPGRCAPVGDFIDVVIGPDGTPWGVFVDGCVLTCVKEPGPNDASLAIVGRLVGGPSLR